MKEYRVTFVLGEAAVEALQDLDAGLPEDEIALQEITSSAIVTREFDSGSEPPASWQAAEPSQSHQSAGPQSYSMCRHPPALGHHQDSCAGFHPGIETQPDSPVHHRQAGQAGILGLWIV